MKHSIDTSVQIPIAKLCEVRTWLRKLSPTLRTLIKTPPTLLPTSPLSCCDGRRAMYTIWQLIHGSRRLLSHGRLSLLQRGRPSTFLSSPPLKLLCLHLDQLERCLRAPLPVSPPPRKWTMETVAVALRKWCRTRRQHHQLHLHLHLQSVLLRPLLQHRLPFARRIRFKASSRLSSPRRCSRGSNLPLAQRPSQWCSKRHERPSSRCHSLHHHSRPPWGDFRVQGPRSRSLRSVPTPESLSCGLQHPTLTNPTR